MSAELPEPLAGVEDDHNHQLVVRVVVFSVAALAFLLYAGAVALIVLEREVPGELWLGAGNASGVLGAMLTNSKSSAARQAGALLNKGSSYAHAAARRAGVPPAVVDAAADRVTDLAGEAVEHATEQVEAELGDDPAADELAHQAELDELANSATRRRRKRQQAPEEPPAP